MTKEGYESRETIGNIGKQNKEQFFWLSLIDFRFDYASCFAFSIVKIAISVIASNHNNNYGCP